MECNYQLDVQLGKTKLPQKKTKPKYLFVNQGSDSVPLVMIRIDYLLLFGAVVVMIVW